ncbi:MAG TPA: nuclear transport factor 2 family protein [Steroidobacteraceae bacterium]|nr:nuclear transport factor 2 family protein [Steroidobacteraceae bacterium]
MKKIAIVGLFLACLPAIAAEEASSKTLVDRLQIQDLITRYYNNFGKENPENFSDFYADDAELILGTRTFKGRDGILAAYGRGPAQANQPPRPPRPQRYSFIVTPTNLLIVVHGKTATAQLVFTEYVIEKQGDPLKLTTQGKEWSTFVKVNGHWRYRTRQIKGGVEPPEGWKE